MTRQHYTERYLANLCDCIICENSVASFYQEKCRVCRRNSCLSMNGWLGRQWCLHQSLAASQASSQPVSIFWSASNDSGRSQPAVTGVRMRHSVPRDWSDQLASTNHPGCNGAV